MGSSISNIFPLRICWETEIQSLRDWKGSSRLILKSLTFWEVFTGLTPRKAGFARLRRGVRHISGHVAERRNRHLVVILDMNISRIMMEIDEYSFHLMFHLVWCRSEKKVALKTPRYHSFTRSDLIAPHAQNIRHRAPAFLVLSIKFLFLFLSIHQHKSQSISRERGCGKVWRLAKPEKATDLRDGFRCPDAKVARVISLSIQYQPRIALRPEESKDSWEERGGWENVEDLPSIPTASAAQR